MSGPAEGPRAPLDRREGWGPIPPCSHHTGLQESLERLAEAQLEAARESARVATTLTWIARIGAGAWALLLLVLSLAWAQFQRTNDTGRQIAENRVRLEAYARSNASMISLNSRRLANLERLEGLQPGPEGYRVDWP